MIEDGKFVCGDTCGECEQSRPVEDNPRMNKQEEREMVKAWGEEIAIGSIAVFEFQKHPFLIERIDEDYWLVSLPDLVQQEDSYPERTTVSFEQKDCFLYKAGFHSWSTMLSNVEWWVTWLGNEESPGYPIVTG